MVLFHCFLVLLAAAFMQGDSSVDTHSVCGVSSTNIGHPALHTLPYYLLLDLQFR